MLIIAEKTKGCVQILLLTLGNFKRINIFPMKSLVNHSLSDDFSGNVG